MSDKTKDNSHSLSEAEKFLESLNLPDSQSTHDASTTTSSDPNDIMSFLDEISKYPAQEEEEEESANKKTTENEQKENTEKAQTEPEQQPKQEEGWMSWGNSFWNQASAAVKSTTDQLNRSVAPESTAGKLLEERVKMLQGFVNKENIEKLSNNLKNITTTIIETVAPPISEHEVVEVWLSYDMVGYTGLEGLVYRAFARVMENTESGQVVVRNPEENKKMDDPTYRELNMCDSLIDGTKLAKANIDHLVKTHYRSDEQKEGTAYSPDAGAVPVIHCPVFMAIQPVKMAMIPIDEKDEETHQVSFIVLLVDPFNKLKFKTYSQVFPLNWLDIPYEENEWVEDKMNEILQMAVTSIAQDYVWTRMSGLSNMQ
ncbi:hypothetical protein K501DRAFT_220624 [Backusella circina FSU 941]|nr:hypothetical protein K501DRAFT_220624 [Backusella circina FSU 941]